MKTYNIHKSIESGLQSLYPSTLQGNPLRRFKTLVSMIVGIIDSQHVSLAKIADNQAGLIQAQSQVKKNDRWLMNKWIDAETFFMPFIISVIRAIVGQKKELVFVIDGSVVGRNCQTLLVSVLWKGKALPVCWKTIQAPKGHFPQADHLALLSVLGDMLSDLPPVRCVMLGDGEYDGQEWIKTLIAMQFEYVLRTAKDTLLTTWEGDLFQPKTQDVGSETYLYIPDCKLSRGILTHFVLWHERAFKDPIALLTNLDIAQLATGYYRKRFKIETLFKDFKSSGFHLHQSKLSNPAKIDRLLIVCGLAYLWLIGLGSLIAERKVWIRTVYKVQKETFNLFTIGKRLFKYLTKNRLRIPDIAKIIQPLKVSV